MSIKSNITLHSNGIVLGLSPLFSSTSLATLLLTTSYGVTRIQSAENYSVEMEFRIIEKYKVTLVKSHPCKLKEMLESKNLAKADLRSIRHIINNGYKSPLFVLEQIKAHLENGEVHNRYGITYI